MELTKIQDNKVQQVNREDTEREEHQKCDAGKKEVKSVEYDRKKVFKCLVIIVLLISVEGFLITGGHHMLYGEVKKVSMQQVEFNIYTNHFDKRYTNESDKDFRMGIFTLNQLRLVTSNGAMIGIEPGTNGQFGTGRFLKDFQEQIIMGTAYGKRAEAYNTGCMGKPMCYLLMQNEYSDQETDEFFAPRKFPDEMEWQFEVELQGTTPYNHSWREYISNTKNQGATNTCYLQVYATVYEIVMNKWLRGLTDEYWESYLTNSGQAPWVREYQKIQDKTCHLDVFRVKVFSVAINQKFTKKSTTLSPTNELTKALKDLPKKPSTRQKAIHLQASNSYFCYPKITDTFKGGKVYYNVSSPEWSSTVDAWAQQGVDIWSDQDLISDEAYYSAKFWVESLQAKISGKNPLRIETLVARFIFVPANRPDQMMLHLVQSPVTIIMYSCNAFEMKSYGIGVYSNTTACTKTEYSHTTVVVGYGKNENGDEYWEMINSYGKTWGNNGIIRLARNTDWDQYGGQNGILHKPAYNMPQVYIPAADGKKWLYRTLNRELECHQKFASVQQVQWKKHKCQADALSCKIDGKIYNTKKEYKIWLMKSFNEKDCITIVYPEEQDQA